MSDINIAAVDSLKVLDPNRPIREADKLGGGRLSAKSLRAASSLVQRNSVPSTQMRCRITASRAAAFRCF